MEEFFHIKGKLFTQTVQKTEGKENKSNQAQDHFRPEIPQRSKQRTAEREKQHHAAKKTKELIDPQFAPCGAEGKDEQQRQHRQGVQHIQCCGEQGAGAAQSQRTQQIIHKTQRPAKQECLQRKTQLQETVDLHTAAFQPKSRCKKPRRDSCSS